MGKRGRLYSPEFKEEAVRLVHSSDERYPVAKIARDLDVCGPRPVPGVHLALQPQHSLQHSRQASTAGAARGAVLPPGYQQSAAARCDRVIEIVSLGGIP